MFLFSFLSLIPHYLLFVCSYPSCFYLLPDNHLFLVPFVYIYCLVLFYFLPSCPYPLFSSFFMFFLRFDFVFTVSYLVLHFSTHSSRFSLHLSFLCFVASISTVFVPPPPQKGYFYIFFVCLFFVHIFF